MGGNGVIKISTPEGEVLYENQSIKEIDFTLKQSEFFKEHHNEENYFKKEQQFLLDLVNKERAKVFGPEYALKPGF